MQKQVAIIINTNSGAENNADEFAERFRKMFAAHGVETEIAICESGGEIVETAKRAAQSDYGILVAGGGDGTVSAIAAEVLRAKKTLGILPLGTLNNFSKDLQIPQDVEEAARIIAENHTKQIDVGEVNGRIFVNNSSIGLYPSIVRQREKQQRLGRGKWSAAFWAAMRILRRSPFLSVKLKTERGERTSRTPFVFVGNNEYKMDFLNIGRRESLSDGKLSVYFLHKSGRRGLFALALRLIFGRLRHAEDFESINTAEIVIETRRKQMLVAFDGEVERLQTPLHYRIHPRALRVIAPE